MEINQSILSPQDTNSELSHQNSRAQPLNVQAQRSEEEIFQSIASYPYASDNEYQLGLSAILGHPETPPTSSELAANEDLVIHAQCFYLARKSGLGQIDVEAYKNWHASKILGNQSILSHDSRTHGSNGIVQPTTTQTRPSQPPQHIPPRPSAPTPSTAAAVTAMDVALSADSQSPPAPLSVNHVDPQNRSEQQQYQQPPPPQPPYPTSFADIVDLITQNKPIPGIETIPETVLELGSSKQDTAIRRKKPWETDLPTSPPAAVTSSSSAKDSVGDEILIDVEHHQQTGEGVLKILQPGAVPDSGLVAKE